MGIEQISTGYRPEFALGALYQGYNAGNADNASQLANMSSQWDLQKRQAQDPLETIVKEYAARLSNAQMERPDYIPWQLQGYIGQMKSQDAAGRMKQATYDDELAATENELRAKSSAGMLKQEELNHYLARIADLKSRRESGSLATDGASGFEMAAPEQPSNFNANYGNEGRGLTPLPILKTEAAMKASMGNGYRSGSKAYDLETIDKEIKLHGDPKGILSAERARIVAELGQGGGGQPLTGNVSGPSPVFSNMASSSTTGGANKWSQGIPGSNPYHEGMMGILMDTPEFRQRMALSEQRTDSAEAIASRRLAAMQDHAQTKVNEPKYKEQLAKHMQEFAVLENRLRTNGKLSDEEAGRMAIAKHFIDTDWNLRTASSAGMFAGRLSVGPEGLTRGPAPVQQSPFRQETPQTQQQKLSPEERAALIKQLQGN